MVDKLDPEVERFIEHRIHSPLDMDILVYFHKNPITVESAKGIARRLGKDNTKEVAKALRRFESRGIVRNMSAGGTPLYAYFAGDNLLPVIDRFVKLITSREGRAVVDSKLIASGKI